MKFDPVMWALAKKSAGGGSGGGGGDTPSGGDDWIGDGNTHIWISLAEGRTSPMLGVDVVGTVTVDWGDGSAPDTLTGTSVGTAVFTPKHQYASAGDYVITLSSVGQIGFVGNVSRSCVLAETSSNQEVNVAYTSSIFKVECGSSVTSIGTRAFAECYNLESVKLTEGVTKISAQAFANCRSLRKLTIPVSVTVIDSNAFANCHALQNVELPNGLKYIYDNAFKSCSSLRSANIPDGITTIKTQSFYECMSLTHIVVPSSVTSIETTVFYRCPSLSCCDFSKHTSVPTLASTYVFYSLPADCIFKIPASLYDEWVAATNWSALAGTYTFVGV